MCGLAGFYSLNASLQKEELEKMIYAIRHRGPDSEGIFFDQRIGLAHKRLSIFDLSSLANQPFFSASGKHVIIYNGEVFNFQELVKELDMPLKTKSDTEIVVELFEKFGVSFVNKFIGMYSIVIYNIENAELYLFRDRLGIKPLYYYWDGKNFIFSSEIKALLTIEKVGKNVSLNNSSIATFLHLGYIPSPVSIYNEIHKVESGSYIHLSNKGMRIEKYWSPEGKIQPLRKQIYREAKEELKALIDSSIKYRLKSDVPLGVLLSGGVDSSLITAIAQKYSSKAINTFTITYEDKHIDESIYAKKIADYIGSKHFEYRLTSNDAKKYIEAVIDNFDEPFADSSALPSFLVSKLAGNYGKVILSGEGGDELFMGYGTYTWSKRMSYPGVDLMKGLFANLIDNYGGRKYKGRSNMFRYENAARIHSHIFSQEQYFFSEEEINEVLNNEYKAEFKLDQNYKGLGRELSLREKQALFDIKYYLKDDLLVKTDMTSMLNSIEARTPLLDHRIVEFALNLPENYKVRNGKNKYILMDILKDYIPNQYFDRPKKGFSMPINKWLRTDLKYLIDEYLSEEEVKRYGILDYKKVAKIKFNFFNGYDYLYVKLWTMVVLQKFLHNNFKNLRVCPI